MTDWVLYHGGPKHGQVLPGHHDQSLEIVFDGRRPWAYYRLTDERARTSRGVVPVAEYIGGKPPARR